jgi:uncharacterized membrane protein YhaH (DUF805 family)
MSFTDAIRDGFSKYATFSGRSSRSAYWWFYLFAVLVIIAAVVADEALGTGGVIYLLVLLGLFLPNLAVTVRRLHDAGHSGWWVLINILPIIGFIVLLVFTVTDSKPPNKWGDGPDRSPGQAPAIV